MPSEKILEVKKLQVAELKSKIDASCAGVLVDYKGISVADDTKLRSELRAAGVEYAVVKNTLLHLAIEGSTLTGLDNALSGTTALALSNSDYVVAAKILSKFASTKKDFFEIKSGYIDGEVISVEKIDELAKLPSREVLLATVLSAFNAPIASFARAIQAIVDKSAAPAVEEAAAPVEEVAAPVEEAAAPVEETPSAE